METTTHKPPTSPGDGRGQAGSAGRPSTRPPEEPISQPAISAESAAAKATEGSELLAADGKPIPIGRGEISRKAAERRRELGRRASASWKHWSDALEDAAKRDPKKTLWTSLGVGVVAGVLLGKLMSRD